MDAEVKWKVTEDYNGLLEAIYNCKRELTKRCFSKFGSAKIVEYGVFAPSKVCELLMLSEDCKPIKGKEFDTYYHKAVANFEQFRLMKTKFYGDDIIRVEAKFEVGTASCKQWYGNVVLV